MHFLGSARMRRLVALVLFAAVMAFGQGRRITDEHEESDHPRERDQWFRRGRPSDTGRAAEKLHRAYEQKLSKRAARRAQASKANVSLAEGSAQQTGSAASFPANGAVWTPLGPGPENSDSSGATHSQDYGPVTGRATAVVIDQRDASGNTVYLGGAYGGLWKSTNAADPTTATCDTATCATNVQWTQLLDAQPTLAVGSIALKPDNSNIVLVGTGESNSSADSYYGLGILRSTDAGQTWTLINSADGGAKPFRGLSFSRIAFNTDTNTSLVVASTAAASAGITVGAELTATTRGLYYSTDAGVTWSYTSVFDSNGVAPSAGSAHSVVYNSVEHKFYAVLRAHGVYSSTNGLNWTQLAHQPGSGTQAITATNCPSVTNLTTCPIYRGEIAVVPGRDEMYIWYVDASDNNGGIYQTRDGGSTWTSVPSSAIAALGSEVDQGTYNLDLAAVPNGTGTDLYAGAVDQWKCTVTNPAASPISCSQGGFINLTHVYGCNPWGSYSHVHPDEHSIDFLHAGTAADYKLIYFANDGGIYRTLNSFATNITGVCGTTPFPFDNLNTNIGSMTQFVWFSNHPSDPATLLGGTQDNGSPATANGGTTPAWVSVNNGDGGYNEINPNSPTEWFTSNTNVSIQRCTGGINCTSSSFTDVVTNAKVSNDAGAFYTPYMLDPQNSGKLIVGTCRVWRGNSDGTNWTSANAVSYPNFSSSNTAACPGSETTNPAYSPDFISALAAGGPKSGTNNTSQVIYAGTEGGKLWVTTNADAGVTGWQIRTGSINPKNYPISSIAIDTSDGTGLTAYVTIMGFDVSHVFRTTDGGATWVDFTGDLPDAPADAVTVDPADPNTVYVGTDVGVFASNNGGVNWLEVGPTSGPGLFPNVAITRMKILPRQRYRAPPGFNLRARDMGHRPGNHHFSQLQVDGFQPDSHGPGRAAGDLQRHLGLAERVQQHRHDKLFRNRTRHL